jgi:hypothetical protein
MLTMVLRSKSPLIDKDFAMSVMVLVVPMLLPFKNVQIAEVKEW